MFITLFRTPFEEEVYVPILRLQDALAMLDKNRIEPILKPVRRSGRSPSSNTYLCLKGCAAVTVERLLQAALARDGAHRAIARELRNLGVRPERGSGTITATTVRNWCDEVSSDFGRHGIAAMMYDKKLASNKAEGLSELPKDQVEQSLLKLRAWVLSLFPELLKPS